MRRVFERAVVRIKHTLQRHAGANPSAYDAWQNMDPPSMDYNERIVSRAVFWLLALSQ
jgi:hypothetical protein